MPKKRKISKWEVTFLLYSWYEIMCLVSWPNIIIGRIRRRDRVSEHWLRPLLLSEFVWLQPWVLLDNSKNWGLSPRVNGIHVLSSIWNVFHNYFKQWLDSYLCLFFLKVLERKISTRQSREELIRRGVLKELPDQGEEINRIFKITWSFILWSFFHFLLEFKMIMVFGR